MLNSINNLLNRRLLTILLLGFSSGLPLALTAGTLQAWYTTTGVNIVTIGFLTLVGQPYLYKFLWAPLMDRYVPPILGRRRGWMLLTQVSLVLVILVMATMNPEEHPMKLALFALIVAFLSASQDVAIDAYRTDILKSEERGLGAALGVGGYRIAMLVSGGLALIMADAVGWHMTYIVMAILMSVGIFASFFGVEPEYKAELPTDLLQAVVSPLKDFLKRRHALAILLFILLYKLAEGFTSSSGVLTNVFLLRGLGFSLTTVGAVNKGIGVVATIIGVFVGGGLLIKMRLYRALMLFGVMQAIANLSFIVLAIVGKQYALLVTTVFIDNVCTGMGTVALVTFMMSLCNQRYTATQFALLSGVAALGRILFGPFAGIIVNHIGWASFFTWTFVFSLPALVILKWIQADVQSESQYQLANV